MPMSRHGEVLLTVCVNGSIIIEAHSGSAVHADIIAANSFAGCVYALLGVEHSL